MYNQCDYLTWLYYWKCLKNQVHLTLTGTSRLQQRLVSRVRTCHRWSSHSEVERLSSCKLKRTKMHCCLPYLEALCKADRLLSVKTCIRVEKTKWYNSANIMCNLWSNSLMLHQHVVSQLIIVMLETPCNTLHKKVLRTLIKANYSVPKVQQINWVKTM